MGTPFSTIYNRFLNRITDDMYMELTPADTLRDLEAIFQASIPAFEFPRQNMYDYEIKHETIQISEIKDSDYVIAQDNEAGTALVDRSAYNIELTEEEINILAIVMLETWLRRQVASIENTRMKYSGSDFKMTSQANHLSKLLSLQTEARRDSMHMQRLYKRRKVRKDGRYASNWSVLRKLSALDYNNDEEY